MENFLNLADPIQLKNSAISRMHGFENNFLDMTETDYIDTGYNVVSIHMAYDSPKIIVAVDKALNENLVKFYDMSGQSTHDPKKGQSTIKPFRNASIKGTHIVSREINQHHA